MMVAPWRIWASVMLPVGMAVHGYRKRSLSLSGALAGLVVGFITVLSGMNSFAALLVFFLSGSKVTKFRGHRKQKFEEGYKEGGQRNWVQIVCNGGVACVFLVGYVFEAGCYETPIDFHLNYIPSLLSLSALSAYACCNGDTWASEVGSVLGSGQPRLVTTWEKVPAGTNGAVSLGGTTASFIGGLLVGVAYYIVLIVSLDASVLNHAPPQWPIVLIGGLAGFVGSMVDSFMGATVQYSGIHEATGHIVEQPGSDVRHISGWQVLNNHAVNLYSSLVTAILMPWLGFFIWKQLVLY